MKKEILNISMLFVEDEHETRKNISDIINRRVSDFFVADNAIKAIEIYKEHKPDLILTDIQMPEMNGLQMIEIIKKINPEVKVIIMTAFTDTSYLLKSIDLQVDGFIVKPIHKEKLLSTIKKQANIILLKKKTKEQEQELIHSEKKFKDLANLLPQIIYETDIKGNITYVNKQGFASFGYSTDTLNAGFNVLSTLLPQDIPRAKQNMQKILSGEQIEDHEYTAKRKDGRLFPISIYSKPIIKNGQPIGMRGIIVDITDQKKAEEDIRKQNIQLQERNEELDAFSHTVAHDLKNPIGAIVGFAGLLHEGCAELSEDEIKKYITIIINSGDKTLQIINSLLLFACVRKEEIITTEINTGNIVADAIKRLASAIEKSNAEINIPETWPTVMGFAPWIEEVWVNYLSNAIKYGGIPPHITIGFNNEESENLKKGMIRFWAHDNGPGISATNQNLLFKKFERLDQVKTEGHGLGLSIVKRIIEKLGGEVGIETQPGNGSLFYFTLPLTTNAKLRTNIPEVLPEHPASSHSESKTASYTRTSSSDRYKASSLKILIAEDEYTSDNFLKIIVRNLSKETLHAKNGKETIEIFRVNPDIDLILMDIKMPIMNGYEATRKIRELDKDVIIIAQTAYALAGDRQKAIEAGCNEYISKPIIKEMLLQKIDKLFGNT